MKMRRITNVWQKFAEKFEKKLPRDVPPGHIAVIVSDASKRFVIKAVYLNHPILRQLLEQAYEEYGHKKNGPLTLPCDEFLFQDIIHLIRGDADVIQFLLQEGFNTTSSRVCRDLYARETAVVSAEMATGTSRFSLQRSYFRIRQQV